LKQFGRPAADGTDPFAEADCREVEHGVVLNKSAAFICCRLVNRLDAGDHTVYLMEAVDGGAIEDRRPYAHIRKNGLNY
jgi:flavin reductase (DIM6/NTAB) family NADH-FMN oxidoreductase RutF